MTKEETFQTKINELIAALRRGVTALDVLLDEKPMLAAKMCGCTTLGNLRAEMKSALRGGEPDLQLLWANFDEIAKMIGAVMNFCKTCEYRSDPGSCEECALFSIVGRPE